MTRPFYLAIWHGVLRSPDRLHLGCTHIHIIANNTIHTVPYWKDMLPVDESGNQKCIRVAVARDCTVTNCGGHSISYNPMDIAK